MSLIRDQKIKKLISYPSNFISGKRLLSNNVVVYLLKALENADYQLCVDIENDFVVIGKRAIKYLIKALESSNKQVQRHAAMALIRMGSDVIAPLLNEFNNKPDKTWLADFIINEIQQKQEITIQNKFQKSIAS
jgi:HEAT repeat protein